MSRQRGFSLVEVMVGLLISLIGTLAMMTAFATFEGQKRTTTSGSDAQQAGSYSLYEMERQLRTAGSGVIQGRSATYTIFACRINARTSGAAVMPPATLPAPFAAVPLTVRAIPALVYGGGKDAGGKALSDMIAVVSGNPTARTFGAPVNPPTSAATIVMTDSAFGMYPKEYLLASDGVVGADGSVACNLGHVASVVDNPTDPNNKTVTFDAPNTTAGGYMTTPAQKYLFDLGVNPIFSLFGVDATSNTLVAFDLLQRNGNAPVAIADGVVLVKALYGVDDGAGGGTANDGVIDEWVVPTAGTTWGADTLGNGSAASAVSISQILAIRVAVVARSQLPERTISADPVNGYAGPPPITLFPDLAAAGLTFSVKTEPQYRYKTYDTTIPLHNAAVRLVQ
ncbi:hypothetical protein GCM10009105_03000 [Dokdonella soli]|uniref:Prepilin-type N-terminal cleavage/methylation domain-containing protein n=2 Tax=Dokdonella soli TaxID=529810 RepID=A0ABN1IBU7_9GAMM